MRKTPSQTMLLYVMGALLALKFAALPLFDWQQSQLEVTEGKRVQKAKINRLIESQDFLQELDADLNKNIGLIRNNFFVDNEKLKLNVQTELEARFALRELRLDRFVWLLDSPGSIRTLKAKIFFTGPVDSLIQVLWDIAASPESIGIVESRQNLTNYEDAFSGTSGFVIVEVRAIKQSTYDSLNGGN